MKLNSLVALSAAAVVVASACGSSNQCGAATCQSGCCTASGQCVESGKASACGTGGATCAVCTTGQTCNAQNQCVAGTGGGTSTGGGTGTGGGTSTGGGTGGGTGTGGGSGGGGGTQTAASSFMVIRVTSDGGLTSAAAAFVLEERALDTGAVTRTIDVTGTSTPAVTLSGSATSEGVLNLSGDKRFVSLACYVAAPGQASVNSTAGIARAVARIAADGTVDTSTRITDSYFLNNIRSAASDTGDGFWLAGASASSLDGGVRYVALGSSGATTPVYSDIQNIRATHVANGILYASTASNPGDAGVTRVFTFGGVPTSAAPASSLPGLTITSPQGLAVLDINPGVPGHDVAYVADSTQGIGLRKFVFSGTAWSEAATFNQATPGNVTCLHVAAELQGSDVVVLCATNESTANRILRFTDVGGAATSSPTPTVLATSPANSIFRGVAFSPR